MFFVGRLLSDLGYVDAEIVPKASLSVHSIRMGRKRVNYKPDYALRVDGRVRWICDAKSPSERLDEWVGQCASYCLELNRLHADNPVEYFLITNGVNTELYRWDSDTPAVSLKFGDFMDNAQPYVELRSLLTPASFRQNSNTTHMNTPLFKLHRRSVSDLNNDFAWAHRYIHRRENLSYGASFMEFVKLVFLKLLSDRAVRQSPDSYEDETGALVVPVSEVKFSRQWIEQREKDHPSPLDVLQFQPLLKGLEAEIQAGTKKRIFRQEETLDLSNETIKALVGRLESTDLYAIDADLNGRLFETFLNATLRGKDLGQYFTPRSVVKLATRLAKLLVTPDHVDSVLDACCGTGGFLIEALAVMWQAVDSNVALTDTQRVELKQRIAIESLYGVDIARDPALARIARINMYLHGDGGSRIYQLDALDKDINIGSNDSLEIAAEKREFKSKINVSPDGFADVVLTNPPFAKEYSRSEAPEAHMLDKYELAYETVGGTRRPLATLRSSVMFLERYFDLLKPGGRMITVVDDGILGGDSYRSVRDWIRRRFIVRAVISLPGDAFQRSQARVKTSLMILEKKVHPNEVQPSVFMYYCTAVGVDDPSRQRVLPIDQVHRELAAKEIEHVGRLYEAFLQGQQEAENWIVDAAVIADRMDVKACLPVAGRRVLDWTESGFEVVSLKALLEPVYDRGASQSRADGLLNTRESDELVTLLRVRYDGFAESGDEVDATTVKSRYLFEVRQGDIVFSHINAIHGAVAVVSAEHSSHYVTNEYTVCRPLRGIDPRLVWSLVRTPEARADLLLLSTGIGRTRIDWDRISQLKVPIPPDEVAKTILDEIHGAELAEQRAREMRAEAQRKVHEQLLMDSSSARTIILAFKPPR